MTTSTAALAPVVDALVSRPLYGLLAVELQAGIAAVAPQVGRLEGWLQAASAQLNVVCGGELPTPEGGRRSVAGWLAEVRHQTAAAAGRDLRISAALRRSLPLVVDAVLDGVLTPEQAAVLSRLVGKIDDGDLAGCQGELIEVAAGRDPAELAAWVRHQIATHCEPALDDAAERGRAGRYLQTSRDANGTVRGRFVLAAEDSETLLTVLEPLARRDGLSDERSAGQRRADALVEVCEQVLRHGELPDSGGQRPQLTYVLPADWAAPPGRPKPPASTADRAAPRTDRLRSPTPSPPPCPASPVSRPNRPRHRRLDRAADPQPDRDDAVRRPDQPGPARQRRPGPRAGITHRHHHRHAAPGAGRPGPGLRHPRLHPTPGHVRRPPTSPPAQTAEPPTSTTSPCSADGITSSGTSANSSYGICTPPGTPTHKGPDRPRTSSTGYNTPARSSGSRR